MHILSMRYLFLLKLNVTDFYIFSSHLPLPAVSCNTPTHWIFSTLPSFSLQKIWYHMYFAFKHKYLVPVIFVAAIFSEDVSASAESLLLFLFMFWFCALFKTMGIVARLRGFPLLTVSLPLGKHWSRVHVCEAEAQLFHVHKNGCLSLVLVVPTPLCIWSLKKGHSTL